MTDRSLPSIKEGLAEITELALRKEAYGEYLAVLRASFYGSQLEFAKSLGTDRSKIVNYEKGKSYPPIGYLAYLLRLHMDTLNVNPQRLQEIQTQTLSEVNTIIAKVYNHSSRARHLHLKKFRSWNEISKAAEEWLAQLQSESPSKPANEPTVLPSTFALPPHLLARIDHYFIGREAEITEVFRRLHLGQIVFLCGPTGMGKTAIATAVIRKIALEDPNRFPDGAFYYNFNDERGVYSVDTALKDIARTYGIQVDENVPPRDAAELALRNKQLLLFFDGAETCDNLTKLLEIQGKCGVLITTQKQRDALNLGIDPIHVDMLPGDLPEILLSTLAGERAGDSAIIKQICDLLGRMTLAIYLIGLALARGPGSAADFLNWLQDAPLKVLDQGTERLQNVPLLLAKCATNLSQAAREVLAILSVLAPSPLEWQVLLIGLGKTEVDIYTPLAELEDYGWIVNIGKTCTIRHILFHNFISQLKDNLLPGSVLRLANYYITHARDMMAQGVIGYERLQKSRMHIIAILDSCQRQGEWVAAKQLVLAIDEYFDLQGYWAERVIALSTGIDATQALGDVQMEATLLDKLGSTYRSLGQYDEALKRHEQALNITIASRDHDAEGKCLSNLGTVYFRLGKYKEALKYYVQALDIAEETDNHHEECNCLNGIGNAYFRLVNFEEAIKYQQRALDIARTIGDRRAESACLGSMGNTYFRLGQYHDAQQKYRQARDISHEIGDRYNEGVVLGNLGEVYSRLGEYGEAHNYLNQALDISCEIGDRFNEGNWLTNLGSVQRRQDHNQEAASYYEQALAIFQKIGARAAEGAVLGFLARVYTSLGHREKAVETYQKAVQLEPHSPSLYNNLATRYLELGQIEEAKSCYQRRIELRSDDALTAYVNLGVINIYQGNSTEASKFFSKALDVFEVAKQRRLQTPADLLKNQALALLGLGQVEQAIETLSEALSYSHDVDKNDLTLYDLLAKASPTLRGFDEMSRLIERASTSS